MQFGLLTSFVWPFLPPMSANERQGVSALIIAKSSVLRQVSDFSVVALPGIEPGISD